MDLADDAGRINKGKRVTIGVHRKLDAIELVLVPSSIGVIHVKKANK